MFGIHHVFTRDAHEQQARVLLEQGRMFESEQMMISKVFGWEEDKEEEEQQEEKKNATSLSQADSKEWLDKLSSVSLTDPRAIKSIQTMAKIQQYLEHFVEAVTCHELVVEGRIAARGATSEEAMEASEDLARLHEVASNFSAAKSLRRRTVVREILAYFVRYYLYF
jgi:hypothetical protein